MRRARAIAVAAGIVLAVVHAGAAGQQTPQQRRETLDRLMAAERGETPEIQALLKGNDPNARDRAHKRTALMWSVFLDDRTAFTRFMNAPAVDVNAKDDEGQTALMLAAEFGAKFDTVPVAETLIAKGADPSIVMPGGMTALILAANSSAVGVVRAILPKLSAKDIEVKNPFGLTALSQAAAVGASEICELLLDKGADIEAVDKEGKTPLMQATGHVFPGTNDTVAVLINAKANINARDKAGNTPLTEATRRGQTAIVDLLKELGAR